MTTFTPNPYIIIGAGGHGVVVADILKKRRYQILGFLDDGIESGTQIFGSTILGKISDCINYPEATFIIGIGHNETRKAIAEKYSINFGTAIHPTATIGGECQIQRGTVIMAGAIVNPRTKIGMHCIINTNAGIDHDNQINNYTHISPNVTTGGDVIIGECSHVGIGSTIKNGIKICPNTTIGAGAVVVKDIEIAGTYIGIPATILRN